MIKHFIYIGLCLSLSLSMLAAPPRTAKEIDEDNPEKAKALKGNPDLKELALKVKDFQAVRSDFKNGRKGQQHPDRKSDR